MFNLVVNCCFFVYLVVKRVRTAALEREKLKGKVNEE